MSIKLEPGKFYKTRSGKKYICYAIHPLPEHLPVHGAIFLESGGVKIMSSTLNGKFFYDIVDSQDDIVDIWIDKPVIDWAKESKWISAIAMDEDKKWFAFTGGRPSLSNARWVAASGEWIGPFIEIPNEFAPPFTGDWKDSFCINPNYGQNIF